MLSEIFWVNNKQHPNKVIKVTLTSDGETVLGGSHKRFGHLITVRLGCLKSAFIDCIARIFFPDQYKNILRNSRRSWMGSIWV